MPTSTGPMNHVKGAGGGREGAKKHELCQGGEFAHRQNSSLPIFRTYLGLAFSLFPILPQTLAALFLVLVGTFVVVGAGLSLDPGDEVDEAHQPHQLDKLELRGKGGRR